LSYGALPLLIEPIQYTLSIFLGLLAPASVSISGFAGSGKFQNI